MKRIPVLLLEAALLAAGTALWAQEGPAVRCEPVQPGVWRYSFGTPDAVTPVSVRAKAPDAEGLSRMGAPEAPPVVPQARRTDRGMLVSIPLQDDELIYGLGLQMLSFQQRGKKKTLRSNADPTQDTGDSHAPVPFYVTTGGYGILVDNARYLTFYLGGKIRRPASTAPGDIVAEDAALSPLDGAYANAGEGREVLVEIPRAAGVDVYVFAGPSMKEAVARYNLFSGGGALPPRWGLGFWYRTGSNFTQDQVVTLAEGFRSTGVPCDVLGLEPGWQSHSYSSSYAWNRKNFPDPAGLVEQLREDGFRVNLWTQGYVHPTSPIYETLLPYSGDYQVWGGIVPNFFLPQARETFIAQHARETQGIGVSGFKADECDNSDYTGNWSFPEIARFPGGLDGEQMHSLFGLSLQQAMTELFTRAGERTWSLVRNSGALAAPLPFVLYSDLYGHQTYINSVAQSGFSGLLWTPEVRDAGSEEDLLRRMQSVVCSPLAMINAWFLDMPPWMQMNRPRNLRGEVDPDHARLMAACRRWIDLRMQLVPYLHAAFVRYHREGIPPFRALIMDYPAERDSLRDIAGQYMMGDDLMVAPLVASGKGETTKKIYFPAGVWYDFFTGERIEGGRSYELTFPLDRMPLYVREGTLLPLARVTLTTEDPRSRELEVRRYGDPLRPAVLYEDDGSFRPSLKENTLSWDARKHKIRFQSDFYRLIGWE